MPPCIAGIITMQTVSQADREALMDYSLVVNGTGNAFLQEFGCPCPRCALREPVANMSVSIVRREGGRIAWHALVDVGLGVVNSLLNTFSPDEARVDWLLFSHWHPDHSLEVNRLGETMRRTARRRGVKFARIPTWCRGGTGKWLSRNYSYEWYRCLEGRPSDESEPPGTLLAPIALGADAIEITPLSVSHSGADINPESFKEIRYNSACFIIRTGRKKTVLLWDLDNKNGGSQTRKRRRRNKRWRPSAAPITSSSTASPGASRRSWGSTRDISLSRRCASMRGPCSRRRRCSFTWAATRRARATPAGAGRTRSGGAEAQKLWSAEGLPGTVRVPAMGEEIII